MENARKVGEYLLNGFKALKEKLISLINTKMEGYGFNSWGQSIKENSIQRKNHKTRNRIHLLVLYKLHFYQIAFFRNE